MSYKNKHVKGLRMKRLWFDSQRHVILFLNLSFLVIYYILRLHNLYSYIILRYYILFIKANETIQNTFLCIFTLCKINGALSFSTGADSSELCPHWHISFLWQTYETAWGRRNKLTASVSVALYFKCANGSGLEELILIKSSMLKSYRIHSVELKQEKELSSCKFAAYSGKWSQQRNYLTNVLRKLNIISYAFYDIPFVDFIRIRQKQKEGGTYSPRDAEIIDTKFNLDQLITVADLELKDERLTRWALLWANSGPEGPEPWPYSDLCLLEVFVGLLFTQVAEIFFQRVTSIFYTLLTGVRRINLPNTFEFNRNLGL